jgi:hypothetical protein
MPKNNMLRDRKISKKRKNKVLKIEERQEYKT